MSDEDALFTIDGTSDPYDHSISLVDATEPQTDLPDTARSSSPNRLAKRTTVTSLREHLAKKKYAKWQQETSPPKDHQDATLPRGPSSETGSPQPVISENGDKPPETEATDFAPQPATSDRGRQRTSKTETQLNEKHKQPHYEVDILYENQRGLFFFGIPLYSHSSLLNFDPAPWVTRDLKDSAVNITNAQVPDPSWVWAWKSWYVDMSYDVDEEGWQYSFSFGRKWVWHGTHPWFHSYVRRRRWLRKRVKRHGAPVGATAGNMHAAHMLNSDYFTIHTKRDKSPISTLATTARTSLNNQQAAFSDPPEDIDNIVALLKALKLATVDREKIDAVKKFLRQGGEELAYLEEQIPEIMSLFVFQTSRRQLVELLQHAAADAKKHRGEHDAEDRPEGEAESRRIDNILKVMRKANQQIGELEYWSDRKHVLQFPDEIGNERRPRRELGTFDGASAAPTEDDPVEEIKGISGKADLGIDPTIEAVRPDASEGDAVGAEDKGKGKATDTTEDEKDDNYQSFNVRKPSSQMLSDSVMVTEEGK